MLSLVLRTSLLLIVIFNVIDQAQTEENGRYNLAVSDTENHKVNLLQDLAERGRGDDNNNRKNNRRRRRNRGRGNRRRNGRHGKKRRKGGKGKPKANSVLLSSGGSCSGIVCSGPNKHWDYSASAGPACWGDCWSVCDNAAKKQSPIDLDTDTATEVEADDEISLTGYNVARTGTLKNNGHTVQFDLASGYSISGFELPDTYKAEQFHFHWGSSNSQGSEHTIDGVDYPMEMHIVHYSDNFSSVADAVDSTDGIAVLGFFIEVSGSDNTDFNPIVNNLQHIPKPDDSVSVSSFNLRNLLPDDDDLETAFRYRGSLTTPECQETVVWTVFDTPIQISQSQMTTMRTSVYEDAAKTIQLEDNFRPIQDFNGTVEFLDAD